MPDHSRMARAQHTDAANAARGPQPQGIGGREASVSRAKLSPVVDNAKSPDGAAGMVGDAVTAAIPGKFGNRGV